MKSLLVLVLICLGCGSKGNDKEAKELDKYINTDLGPSLARVLAARAAYADIKATDAAEKPAMIRYKVHDVALPFLNQAIDGASKVTPPASQKQWHESLVLSLKSERDAIAMMDANLDNPEMFEVAHARMMGVQEVVMSSERSVDKLLADHNVKLSLPKVEVPQPQAAPPPSDDPMQCKPGTAKREADGFVSCETEMMFSPPETVAGTPRESVVVCGPGEVVFAATGALVTCVSFGKLKIGETDIAKGAKITFGEKAHVTRAELPDGKPLCFDENNSSIKCP